MSFNVWHSRKGKSELIITAGMDGDEYTGIEAAKKLISDFTKNPPTIPITIIPCVNVKGNKQGVDYNPVDSRYPKHIYPGFPLGSSTSRLMYRLSHLVAGNKLWLDLHGGNSHEHLIPFLWADQTGRTPDNLIEHLLSHLPYPAVYSEDSLAPSRYLSKRNTSYLIFECGGMGETRQSDITKHVSLVKKVLALYSAFPKKSPSSFVATYSKAIYYAGDLPSPKPPNLLWYGPNYYYLGK